MIAVIYTRIATYDRNALDVQLAMCGGLIKKMGWTFLVYYSDEGINGASRRPPMLEQLLSDIEQKKIAVDVLVIRSLDRLSRHPGRCYYWQRRVALAGIRLFTADTGAEIEF